MRRRQKHIRRLVRLGVAVIIVTLAVVTPAASGSTTSIYRVTLNTAPLVGHPAGPFTLWLAFTDGSGTGDGNNTVTLSNVDFGGGSASGNPTLFGGASGALETGVTMTDSLALNEFWESFNAGSTLQFTLSLSTAHDEGDIPDGFILYILDSSGAQIPTLAPAGDCLLTVGSGSTGGILQTFASDVSRSPSNGGPISMSAPAFQFLSRQVKSAAQADLQSLVPTGDNQGDGEILEAVGHIGTSLASGLWADDLHLTASGRKVFDEEREAVRELAELRHSPTDLSSQLDDVAMALVRVDKALAQTALHEATQAGGAAEELTKAQEDMARGDQLAKRKRFGQAIERYKDAWDHAERSMQTDTTNQ